ncbi:MAG: hypothetical protein ACXAC5_03775 [Promethearchaeota archaeon]
MATTETKECGNCAWNHGEELPHCKKIQESGALVCDMWVDLPPEFKRMIGGKVKCANFGCKIDDLNPGEKCYWCGFQN